MTTRDATMTERFANNPSALLDIMARYGMAAR